MASVRLVALRKQFEDTPVLRGLDLAIDDRELVTLLGPSGCGKTTTLRCIAGLERPDGGEVRIGEDVVASPAGRVFVPPNRRDVGMVFQSYALWPHMSVFANVAYPLRVRRVARSEVSTRVGEVLASVGMDAYARRPVTDLSGGQQQRVALARALVGRPRVLLLDEPLSNLDAKLRLALRKEIRAAHERAGTTSVYVTHDQAEAIALSDRVVVLHEGAIQQVGTPLEIHRRPANRFVAEFVGFDNVVDGTVAEVRDGAVAVSLQGSRGLVWARTASADGPSSVGSAVVIAIRAEDVRLLPAAEAGSLPQGTVSTCAYAGERWEYGIELAGGPLIVRRPDEDEARVPPGETVAVQFTPDRVVLLPGDPSDPRPATEAGDQSQNALTEAPSPARG